jgi:hypothetical protein
MTLIDFSIQRSLNLAGTDLDDFDLTWADLDEQRGAPVGPGVSVSSGNAANSVNLVSLRVRVRGIDGLLRHSCEHFHIPIDYWYGSRMNGS